MKNLIRNLFLILVIAPFLVQCASQNEVRDLQYQLRIVNKKLEDMKANTVGMIQKRQADSSGQMTQLEEEVMTLKSQLQETNQLNNNLKEKNTELETAFNTYTQQEATKQDEVIRRMDEEKTAKEAKLAELSDKLKAQQESVKVIQEGRVREAERRAHEAKLAAEKAKAKTQLAGNALTSSSSNVVKIGATQQKKLLSSSVTTSESSTSAPLTKSSQAAVEPPPTTTVSPKAQETVELSGTAQETASPPAKGGGLAEAKNLYGGGKYQQAFTLYEQYVRDNATGSEAIDARYMMGECLFQQKEYDQAILQYQKIIAQQAKHPKAASAMLRQAMSFEKLSDNETAKIIYQKILSSYGSSPEAAQAQEKLNKM
ncbi:MAG: tetratricopeptide repeat protein [Desulfoprunum sp.]|nr:tetratricopeptide repeat protein [Desulfoprunum sp.]